MSEEPAPVEKTPHPVEDAERMQIRELLELTPAERMRLLVESSRKWMAMLERKRIL